MSVEFPFSTKIVSPLKCNEKPWDLWVSEIGHSSPRQDEDGSVFAAPEAKGGGSLRRAADAQPYKLHARYRRTGLNRLRNDTMSLHGLFPQMDNLNAAVCHMCGLVVKCSAAYRHLLDSHNGSEPLLPPPPPATIGRVKSHSRSRHKKEVAPPLPPVDILPVKMETSPIHTATAPLSRVLLAHPELQYLDEASSSAGVTAEVQVCVERGELPVVSIQDTDDLPLGENLTDDILTIMNSEGIQSADDATDWKNIIRDIGNLQDINFTPTTDTVQSQEMYTPIDPGLSAYAMSETDLSSLQFAPHTSPMLQTVIDTSILNAQALKPVSLAATPVSAPVTSSATKQSRSKSSKSKINSKEYDPNKHCGVVTAENPKPCIRSLTCKAHALSLRRTVEGRSKAFDILLAEHRAAREASTTAAAPPPAAPLPPPPLAVAAPQITIPPIASTHLVTTPMSKDLTSFINGLTAEQQVNDIYESLLNGEDPNSIESSITSLLNQPAESFLLADDIDLPVDVTLEPPAPPELLPPLTILPPPAAVPPSVSFPQPASVSQPVRSAAPSEDGPPPLVPTDVCWYSSSPRPLALCTFNASHAGGAIMLGKKFATVRSNIKSSLTRSQCKTTGSANSFYYGQNSLSLSKSAHMNSANKVSKPEVRKLIVTCSATSGTSACGDADLMAAASEELRPAINGHVGHGAMVGHGSLAGHGAHVSHAERRRMKPAKRPAGVLDLGYVLDPLLADEKC